MLVAFGAGDGSFQQGGLYSVAGANSDFAIAALDVNRDGRPDLVAATSEGIVILWNDPAPPPPPVPSVPRPISPVNNAFISQNDPASSCPADPLLGSGYRIPFAWMPSEPSANVRGYELFATLRGAPQPIVKYRRAVRTVL